MRCHIEARIDANGALMLQGMAMSFRSTTSEEQLWFMNGANKALTPLMTSTPYSA